MRPAHGLLILATALLAGCVAQEAKPPPCKAEIVNSAEPVVCNRTGSFAYSRLARDATRTDTYDWPNPNSKAYLKMESSVSRGAIRVTLLDAAATPVHSRSQTVANTSGIEVSETGEPGTWKVTVDVSEVTGQVKITITST